MAGERTLNFGADETAARWQVEDAGDGSNFVLARDLDGAVVLLEYDVTASEWVVRGPVDLDGNDLQNVGTLSNDNYVEPQVTASASTSYSADLTAGNYHKVTLTGDVSIDVTNADATETNSVVVHLVQDATGGRTPSFTPTVVWDDGTAPSWSTAANAEDVVTLVHDQDGGQWLGFVGGLGMA